MDYRIKDYKAEFLRIYKENITREGSKELLNYIESSDFFTAPASTRFHSAFEGGLCEHSVKAYYRFMQLLENEYDVLASDLIETEEDNNKLGLKSIVVDESSSKGFSFPYEEIKEETVYIKNANFLYKIDLNYSQDDYLPIKNNFNVDPDEHIFNSVNIDNVDFLLEENLKNNASQKFNIDDLSQIAKQVETAKITPVTETVEEEDDNFEVIVASETMAKIFVKQKAYKKAIKVYEMLISEKPDKKEYFGQQIKELEEKL